MLVCASIIGIPMVTVGWMLGISYIDYLVASYRRFESPSEVNPRLAVERLLGLPWSPPQWVASGVIVFVFSTAAGLLGFWVLVVLSMVGCVVVGNLVLSDRRQLTDARSSHSGPPVTPEAWLYGIRGDYAGHRIRLDSRGLSIGRSASNALRLGDRSISRHHALIRFGQGRWFLQDQESMGGTFVNGRRVGATGLKDGDRIQIGSMEFEFWVEQTQHVEFLRKE